MSIILNTPDPGILGLLFGPKTRADHMARAKKDAQTIATLRRERDEAQMMLRVVAVEHEAALAVLDMLAKDHARRIRPVTAGRRAGEWSLMSGMFAARVAAVFATRAGGAS